MNLNKRSYSPPPLNPLELVVVQVKVLLTEYLQTMMQVSFILQQAQMLQMQLAPNPKAKKRKESSDLETEGQRQESTRSMSNEPQASPNTFHENSDPTTATLNKSPLSTDTFIKLFDTIQPFMTHEQNKQYWSQCEHKVNSHFWFNSMLFDEKVNQIEAVWAKRLFIDNNKTLCEQKHK